MSRFQACVGPSMNKVHIRDTENPSRLVICCATVAVRNYKGALGREHLCVKCAREFFCRGGSLEMNAETLGVRELF